jgi:translocation and assembly module TamB
LLQTATVSYAPDRITAQKLAIGSRAGRVALDGVLARGARNDLSLTVDDVSLKEVCVTAGLTQPCGGTLEAALRLAGTAKAPDVSGAIHVRNLALSGQGYGGAEIDLSTEQRLVVRGSLGKAPLGPLALDARLPLVGGWPVPSLNPQGQLDASLGGNDIQLTGFRTFAESSLSALGGQADVQITVSGTLASPRLAGGVSATGVVVGLAATGTTWKNGRLRLSFADQNVRLDELALEDGQGGTVSGSGGLAFAGDQQGVDVQIMLASLMVFARPEMDAKASGRIQIGGSVASPRIGGNLHIDSATIRPALLPGGSGPPPDPTITIVYEEQPPEEQAQKTVGQALAQVPGASPTREEKAQAAAAPGFMDRVAMAVTVTLGDPVVVQRIDANVRLTGQVYVTKEPADALRISGQISSDRGWYMFRGRRIVLQSAYILFSGETPIDPYLTVTATYQVPDYVVTVRVEGTARAPKLELSSEPALDQSDVLSLLLFGKTTSQLTGGQSGELRQEALGILASYVAPELEQSLMDTFGLASLTFQLPTGSSYGSVGVGRYIGDDIFVSVGQTFGGPTGGTTRQLGGLIGSSLTVQYYLTSNVTVQTSSSTEGESALDVVWHMLY